MIRTYSLDETFYVNSDLYLSVREIYTSPTFDPDYPYAYVEICRDENCWECIGTGWLPLISSNFIIHEALLR